jgi:hypothetical protein
MPLGSPSCLVSPRDTVPKATEVLREMKAYELGIMREHEMMQLFRAHREAEARRDYDAILETFAEDCYIETIALGLRSEGREAARAAYIGFFTAFPISPPTTKGWPWAEDALVAWGVLRGTSGCDWLGVAPSGSRSPCDSRTWLFSRMGACWGEHLLRPRDAVRACETAPRSGACSSEEASECLR